MSQRSSISTTLKIAILPYALSIFPFLCVSELHGALSGHIFEETAERSLVFKSQNIGNLFGAFVAVKQETFSFRFHPFVDNRQRQSTDSRIPETDCAEASADI